MKHVKKIKTLLAMSIRVLILMSLFNTSFAQKTGVLPKTKQTLVSPEEIQKINEILNPTRTKIQQLLEADKSGQYQAYQENMKALEKSISPKSASKIQSKYANFFADIWKAADVPEAQIQQSIIAAVPQINRRQIIFTQFLGIIVLDIQNTGTTPVEALPPNQCKDVCGSTAGFIDAPGKGISGGDGSYGNCYLKTNSWAAVAGQGISKGQLKNTFTVPGSFPDDKRKLRVTVTFDYSLTAYSWGVPAIGWAVGEYGISDDPKIGGTRVMAFAPGLGVNSRTEKQTFSLSYVIEKKDIGQALFKCYSESFSAFVGSSGSSAECNNIRWTICEE